MADYRISWLLADHVILLQLIGEYSEALLDQQVQRVSEYAQQGTAPVYVIVDTMGATSLPKNLKEPLSVLTSYQLNKVAWVIFITANTLFRFLGSLAGKFIGVNFRPVASLEEAVEVLLRINPALDGLRQIDLAVYDPS